MAWQSIDVHEVVERGDTSTLTQYLKIGGDPNKHDPNYGATPVHWAAFHGMFDALTLLLDHGADLEARTNTGGTALAWGCMGGDARVVRHMLDRGADLFAVNQGKGTALHHATHSGHPELVDMLLKAGANPSARDSQNELPGESFDREVSDADRRAITKALRKAKGEGQTVAKVIRVGADSGRKSRFYSKNRSTSSASIRVNRSKKKRSSASKSRSRRESQKKMESTSSFFNSHRSQGSMLTSVQQFQSARLSGNDLLLLEEEGDNESVLAAKAALAAVAWSPKELHLQQNGNGTENGIGKGTENGIRKGNENGHHRGSGSTSGEGPTNGKSIFSTSGHKQINFEENRDKFGNPLEAVAETGTEEVDAELAGLLRRTKDLNLAAEAAAARDVESRNALRKRMAVVDKRALETVKAERERSEGLYALVQALEQRLREREDQVRVLQAQLKACSRQPGNTAPCSIEEDVQRAKDNGVVGGDEVVPRSISSHSHEASSTEREHTLTEAPPSAPTVEDSGSRAGKRAWWKKDRQEGTIKKQSPPPAAAVDQERSGKLFAMIGRK